MKDDHHDLDPVEKALRELEAAEKARLFEPTRVDPHAVLDPTPGLGSSKSRPIPWRSASLWAAALVAALGVASWFFGGEITTIGNLGMFVTGTSGIESAGDDCDGSFFGCVAGPSRVVMAGCRRFDYDADGDVDLADFGSYQLFCKGIRH